MTKREFALFAAALKTYYSKEERLIPNDKALELWYSQLQDIPYEVAEAVLSKWVATQKWSPSIAEIREQAAAMIQGDIPDWSEGWEKTLRAIRYFGIYRQKEALESLDQLTREVVTRLGFHELCVSENAAADRANFRQVYQILAERKRNEVRLPPALVVKIEKIIGGTSFLPE